MWLVDLYTIIADFSIMSRNLIASRIRIRLKMLSAALVINTSYVALHIHFRSGTFLHFVVRFVALRATKRTTDKTASTLLPQAEQHFNTRPRDSCNPCENRTTEPLNERSAVFICQDVA
jgi:hypothetical protein